MKINHNVIIGILKTITIAGFFVAISIKLYNVYKYGGTTKPSTTPVDVTSNEVDEDEGEGDGDISETYSKYSASIKKNN